MSVSSSSKATLPPPGIVGLKPEWSRLVVVDDPDNLSPDNSGSATWHLLDSWHSSGNQEKSPAEPQLTILCVHGNPSWSFLWRSVLAAAPASVRVIAVDQLDMGFSQRTGIKRPLATRVDDLCRLTKKLELKGPVVTLAHDWGGPISLGWALRHVSPEAGLPTEGPYLKGVILTNTSVCQPEGASAPSVIRLIRSKLLLKATTVLSTAFIRGAYWMSKPKLPPAVRQGFLAPYRGAKRRAAIADFVADIPLDSEHESASTLAAIAGGLASLEKIPALLLWGPRDRVFSDLYLNDLEQRLPHADVHRYPRAAHFLAEDADISSAVMAWVAKLDVPLALKDQQPPPEGHVRALADFSHVSDSTVAVTELAPKKREISFGQLRVEVDHLAAGMQNFGINPGARVAVMILPGIELARVVYACWRLGAVLVLVDSGLGRQGMQDALIGARPDFLIGIDKALVAAKLLGWPGRRIALGQRSVLWNKSLGIRTNVEALAQLGESQAAAGSSPDTPLDTPLGWPAADSLAAIAFTSGSTGPSKGVVYKHAQIQAQRDQLASLYGITSKDSLVAAFAPFALYGPTLGISSVVPDMDVTKPSSLTAVALANAVQAIDATLVFASPAALVNVVATGHALGANARQVCSKVRLALSAGAPVRTSLLEDAGALFVNASMHTPYGMTELLPLADINLQQLHDITASLERGENLQLGPDAGVCVGLPVPNTQLLIDPLDVHGATTGQYTEAAGVLGEIVVSATHQRDKYDRLWHTQYCASIPQGFHRTGDVGQLDVSGRLWVGGRLVHIVVTTSGVLAPVAYEQHLEAVEHINMAAVVGVGPVGLQLVVGVVQMDTTNHAPGPASLELMDRIRASVPATVDIAAVLVVEQLPVDRRHNSKVDRTAVADWASRVLSGDRVSAL